MSFIVKDNALINASYLLELVECRLVFLAIIKARETGKGIDANTALKIHASSYINNFHVEKHSAYTSLKQACEKLFTRQFSYSLTNENDNKAMYKSRWVSKIGYIDNEACVELIFAPDVVPLITRLEKHFTSFEISKIAKLQSKYAVRIYELLISWKNASTIPTFEVNDFRTKIGIAETEYPKMSNFKQRVLEPALEQINEHTDIIASYEQHKKGRVISGFSFSFKQKPQQQKEKTVSYDKDTIDMFYQMTESQLDLFSSKLSELSEVQKMAHAGEDMKPFVARLRSMLKDKQQQKKLAPFLAKVGYK